MKTISDEHIEDLSRRFKEYVADRRNEVERNTKLENQASTIRQNLLRILSLSDTELRIVNSNERIKFDEDPVFTILSGGFTNRDTKIYHKKRRDYPWYFWSVLKVYRERMRNRSMDARLYAKLKGSSINQLVEDGFNLFRADIVRDVEYWPGRTIEEYRNKAEGYKI